MNIVSINGDELAIIATERDRGEAEYLRDRIEEQGIEVFLPEESVVAHYVFVNNEVGETKLRVFPKDAAAALKIVEETRAPDIAAEFALSEDKNEDTGWGECPKCHSKKIKPYRAFLGWKGILMFFGLSINKPQRTLVCSNCDNEWKDS